MSDYTAKRINDMEAAFGGGFVKARAELGVTSFGMQVIQLPPDYADYPEHDHAESGQEEVFLALGGSGWIEIEGERVELDAGHVRARRRGAQAQGLSPDPRACACSRSAARPASPTRSSRAPSSRTEPSETSRRRRAATASRTAASRSGFALAMRM